MPIITSPALVVTPAYSYEAFQPLVGWDNRVLRDNLTADEEHDEHPVTNLANPNTNLRWQGTTTGEQVITVSDLEGQTDYVGLARHNFGSGQIEVSVEGITAEPEAEWQELAGPQTFADDKPIIFRFEKGYYTDLRLRLTPDAEVPRLAILHVGELIALRPGLQPGYVPLNRALDVRTFNGRAERGEHLGTIIEGAELASTAQLRDVDPDYYAEVLSPFVAAANMGSPFFFAWAPADHPDEVAFAWLASSTKPVTSQRTGQIDLSFDMRGLAL